MAIFKKKEQVQTADTNLKISDDDLAQVDMTIDYAKKARNARIVKWTAVAVGALLLGFGVGGAAFTFGTAMYAILFPSVATALMCGGVAVGANHFHKKYRWLNWVQKKVKERDAGVTKRGKTMSTDKQTSLDNKINKRVNKLTKASRLRKKQYITEAQGEQFRKGRDNTSVVRAQNRKAAREALLSSIQQNRASIKEDFLRNMNQFLQSEDRANYKMEKRYAGTIEVLMPAYDENGAPRVNTDGEQLFSSVVKAECDNYVDLLKAQQEIYNSLANGNVDYPINVDVASKSGKLERKTIQSREQLEEMQRFVDAKTAEELKAYKIEKPAENSSEMGKGMVGVDTSSMTDKKATASRINGETSVPGATTEYEDFSKIVSEASNKEGTSTLTRSY